MKCSICNGPIKVLPTGWSTGNDARPVKDGRCCDECNLKVVIPRRFESVLSSQYPEQRCFEDPEG